MLTVREPLFEETLDWFQFAYTADQAGDYMAPVSTVLDQYAIAEGDELLPSILLHIRRLYPEVYGLAVTLGRAPVHREFTLGEDGEGLSGGNISVNRFSKLGDYTGRFDNLSSIIARMNNPSPILTNVYLDTPPMGLTPEPLEYTPPPGRLWRPHRYPQTRTGEVPHTGAPPPQYPPPSTHPHMYPPTGQAQPRREVVN